MSSSPNNSLPSIQPTPSGSGSGSKQLLPQLQPQQQQLQHRTSPDQSTSSHRHRGRTNRGPNVGGKYKQRQQMSQLIDGMDGLDMDLVESLVPTNKPGDATKGRHLTATRKVNLTHLLNHERRTRDRRRHGSFNEDRSHDRHPHNFYRESHNVHKFNKQQFLQANCQFVVLPYYDYSIHKLDPDWPVDWDCIEEVKFRQTGATETTCPICLDPPVSAKITKCGHIYCWTCILHYLSLSDEKSRQCPICFEPISEVDLRSVVSRLYSNHAIDEEITMRLMFRRKGCVEIEPFMGTNKTGSTTSCELDEHYESQASLLIVDPATVINQVIRREQDELFLKLETDRDEPEVCFVEQAIDRLHKRIEKLQVLSNGPANIVKNPKSSRDLSEISTSQKDEKTFLFYQSSDGQHIYLNPFSAKILCHEFGSLENCPLEIRAKILQMDWISMSDSWRKRFKYLDHLPLTCEFRLIEIDFEASHLVSESTLALFLNQIKRRASERAYRKTEELKREKIIQIEQNRKIYGIQPSLNINLDNLEQFPFVDEDTRSDQLSAVVTNVNIDSEDTNAQVDGEPSHLAESNLEESLPAGTILSFKEIQERQEAVEASKSGPKTQPRVHKAATGPAKAQQSSFAKLLVDAKSSPKQWTRNAKANTSRQESSVASNSPQIPEDEDGQELRAPPYRFTLSDVLVTERAGKRSRKKANANQN